MRRREFRALGDASIIGFWRELIAHGYPAFFQWFRRFWGLMSNFAGVFEQIIFARVSGPISRR
jgi:hypothetical protein